MIRNTSTRTRGRERVSSQRAALGSQRAAIGSQRAALGPNFRVSSTISQRCALSLVAAAAEAYRLGCPPTLIVTINLEQLGATFPATALGDVMKALRHWVVSQDERAELFWVRECGPVVGQHAHIAVHVSANLIGAVKRKLRRWICRHCGRLKAGSYRTIEVEGWRQGFGSVVYMSNLARIVEYMLKDATRRTKATMRIQREGQWGRVTGRRTGSSIALGPKAVAARGADPIRAPWQLRRLSCA